MLSNTRAKRGSDMSAALSFGIKQVIKQVIKQEDYGKDGYRLRGLRYFGSKKPVCTDWKFRKLRARMRLTVGTQGKERRYGPLTVEAEV